MALSGYRLARSEPLRIAISGRSGCGNTTVSRMLAEALDISFINFTFRSLSVELKLPLAEILERAKRDFSYDRIVDTRQVELAMESSCVLGSRLAIWMLTAADLKVYLTASEEVRARRIQAREGGSLEEIRSFTAMRDAEDTRRYLELYEIDNTDVSISDLTIDTEPLKPEAIVSVILERLIDRGLVVRD